MKTQEYTKNAEKKVQKNKKTNQNVWLNGNKRSMIERRTNDIDGDVTMSKGKDALEEIGGPMTRAKAKKAKEALPQVLSILFEYKPKF